MNIHAFALLQLVYKKYQEGKKWLKVEEIEDILKENELSFGRKYLNSLLRDVIMIGSVEARYVNEELNYGIRVNEN